MITYAYFIIFYLLVAIYVAISLSYRNGHAAPSSWISRHKVIVLAALWLPNGIWIPFLWLLDWAEWRGEKARRRADRR